MTFRIFTIILIPSLCLTAMPGAAGDYAISSHHSGSITIHDRQFKNEKDKFFQENPLIPLLSQVGTGLSLFTTSILFATGYSEERMISNFGKHLNIEGTSGNTGTGIYAGEILLLLGTLSASLFNYRLGLSNDLLAIIPILPVEVSTGGASSSHGMNDQQLRLQFGIYFYFSRDF